MSRVGVHVLDQHRHRHETSRRGSDEDEPRKINMYGKYDEVASEILGRWVRADGTYADNGHHLTAKDINKLLAWDGRLTELRGAVYGQILESTKGTYISVLGEASEYFGEPRGVPRVEDLCRVRVGRVIEHATPVRKYDRSLGHDDPRVLPGLNGDILDKSRRLIVAGADSATAGYGYEIYTFGDKGWDGVPANGLKNGTRILAEGQNQDFRIPTKYADCVKTNGSVKILRGDLKDPSFIHAVTTDFIINHNTTYSNLEYLDPRSFHVLTRASRTLSDKRHDAFEDAGRKQYAAQYGQEEEEESEYEDAVEETPSDGEAQSTPPQHAGTPLDATPAPSVNIQAEMGSVVNVNYGPSGQANIHSHNSHLLPAPVEPRASAGARRGGPASPTLAQAAAYDTGAPAGPAPSGNGRGLVDTSAIAGAGRRHRIGGPFARPQQGGRVIHPPSVSTSMRGLKMEGSAQPSQGPKGLKRKSLHNASVNHEPIKNPRIPGKGSVRGN